MNNIPDFIKAGFIGSIGAFSLKAGESIEHVVIYENDDSFVYHNNLHATLIETTESRFTEVYNSLCYSSTKVRDLGLSIINACYSNGILNILIDRTNEDELVLHRNIGKEQYKNVILSEDDLNLLFIAPNPTESISEFYEDLDSKNIITTVLDFLK